MYFTCTEPRNKCVLDTFTNLLRKIGTSIRCVSLEEKNRLLHQYIRENHFTNLSHAHICFPNHCLQKSWKRRFFVLLKYRDNTCQLKYYKNEEKNKPLGDIDLSKYVQNLHSAQYALHSETTEEIICFSVCPLESHTCSCTQRCMRCGNGFITISDVLLRV